MRKFLFSVLAGAILAPALVLAAGNTTNDSFARAKKMLSQVYEDHRVTLYCGAQYDAQGNVTLPEGIVIPIKRANRVEWEHVVPAENFGRAFDEWREGSPECVDNRGKAFKGRRCAEKANMEYRHMQADMYNLYPAIGAVNAMRSNFSFQMLPGEESSFGSCEMKIADRKAEPPARARGQIARTYFYMQDAYPRYKMSRQQEQLMGAWDKMYPVDQWECTRAKRIEAVQGNENRFVKEPCVEQGLW
ncbi:endonuclease [Desulfovibrio falkowii]|uniref:Extracellular deoxyribonuclease Dns n=1 Tax=Desulfovibrio falkowii TaxID=3136602 RepID=A0ABQ0EB06_9BACT